MSLKTWAQAQGFDAGGKADPKAKAAAHANEDKADDLARKAAGMGLTKAAAPVWRDAADHYDVAADAYEEATMIRAAENVRKEANRCRVQAYGLEHSKHIG